MYGNWHGVLLYAWTFLWYQSLAFTIDNVLNNFNCGYIPKEPLQSLLKWYVFLLWSPHVLLCACLLQHVLEIIAMLESHMHTSNHCSWLTLSATTAHAKIRCSSLLRRASIHDTLLKADEKGVWGLSVGLWYAQGPGWALKGHWIEFVKLPILLALCRLALLIVYLVDKSVIIL